MTHPDIIRYFMTIPEACRLVLEAAFMGKGNEIFVFDMGTPVKIVDLARRMIELAGLIPGEISKSNTRVSVREKNCMRNFWQQKKIPFLQIILKYIALR